MGPPREHGGMLDRAVGARARGTKLQWGRRVNTAEWMWADILILPVSLLQWGRRVNTAECLTSTATAGTCVSGFNGAAA